jgi:hypothetical protein
LLLVLEFDVSEWTDVADSALVEKYEAVSAQFQQLCNRIRTGDTLRITYSQALRDESVRRYRAGTDPLTIPLTYYPFGYGTYTSSYTREGREDYPEVSSVEVVDRGGS